MAREKINGVEKLFVYLFTGAIDLACLLIGWIPGIDLIGWLFKVFGQISLSTYFFIRLGSRYFGGKRGGQKLATTIINTVVEAFPAVDDFIPSLTIEAGSMYWILDKETAEETASAARQSAANDNQKQAGLSRAA
ncbi:MAG TPA: hypothetical protein VGN56_01355 [Candidatus Paceibacterota bacterium]|jgi:hypothetical protein|nr:hypothetical protein [Candidatus Paceibacterota bacterium]